MLTKSEEYRENARNCGELAGEAKDLPSKNRYRRMQDAWLALAEEQLGAEVDLRRNLGQCSGPRPRPLVSWWSERCGPTRALRR